MKKSLLVAFVSLLVISSGMTETVALEEAIKRFVWFNDSKLSDTMCGNTAKVEPSFVPCITSSTDGFNSCVYNYYQNSKGVKSNHNKNEKARVYPDIKQLDMVIATEKTTNSLTFCPIRVTVKKGDPDKWVSNTKHNLKYIKLTDGTNTKCFTVYRGEEIPSVIDDPNKEISYSYYQNIQWSGKDETIVYEIETSDNNCYQNIDYSILNESENNMVYAVTQWGVDNHGVMVQPVYIRSKAVRYGTPKSCEDCSYKGCDTDDKDCPTSVAWVLSPQVYPARTMDDSNASPAKLFCLAGYMPNDESGKCVKIAAGDGNDGGSSDGDTEGETPGGNETDAEGDNTGEPAGGNETDGAYENHTKYTQADLMGLSAGSISEQCWTMKEVDEYVECVKRIKNNSGQ